MPARMLERRPLRGLWPLDCISPGLGIAGSFKAKLFMRLERLRSMLCLTGDPDSGERCSPALIVAAAAREDKEGERGEGGPGCVTMPSVPASDMRRDPWRIEELDADVRGLWWIVLISGDIVNNVSRCRMRLSVGRKTGGRNWRVTEERWRQRNY